MREIYIVDRVEGENIVIECENGDIINVKKTFVDDGVKSGDCLIKKDNYFNIDKEETEKRKNKISKIMKGMWID